MELGWAYDADDMLASWKALVGSTTWMPGARLRVVDEMGYIVLRVRLETKDSFHPENDAVIGHRHPLTRMGDPPLLPGHMEHMLRERLQWVAVHEADEWIVIGGRRPFNPHRRR